MLFKRFRSRITSKLDPLGPGHISMAWLNFNAPWDFEKRGTLRLSLEPPHKGFVEIKLEGGQIVGSIPGTDLTTILWSGDRPA